MYSVANHKLSQSRMPTLSYIVVLLTKIIFEWFAI
jgi:hypothetical protein